jgi:hypothetical protein
MTTCGPASTIHYGCPLLTRAVDLGDHPGATVVQGAHRPGVILAAQILRSPVRRHRRAHDAACDDGKEFESSIDLRSERRCLSSGPVNQTYGLFTRVSVIVCESIPLRAPAVINQTAQ